MKMYVKTKNNIHITASSDDDNRLALLGIAMRLYPDIEDVIIYSKDAEPSGELSPQDIELTAVFKETLDVWMRN